jgi:hypothetical protein
MAKDDLEWAETAIAEMARLKVGDTITELAVRITYQVRGHVDGWVIARYRSKSGQPWSYTCFSPAWWSVYSKGKRIKIRKGRA